MEYSDEKYREIEYIVSMIELERDWLCPTPPDCDMDYITYTPPLSHTNFKNSLSKGS